MTLLNFVDSEKRDIGYALKTGKNRDVTGLFANGNETGWKFSRNRERKRERERATSEKEAAARISIAGVTPGNRTRRCGSSVFPLTFATLLARSSVSHSTPA